MKARLWYWVFLLALFVVFAWIFGPTVSWHIVTYVGLALAGLFVVGNIIDGFLELRQRRRDGD